MAKNSALSWIVKEAKRLRNKSPKRNWQWKDYVAQASATYKRSHKAKPATAGKKKRKVAGKKKAVKKKTAVKRNRAPKRKTSVKLVKSITRTVGSKKRRRAKPRPKTKGRSRRRAVSGKGGSGLLLGLAVAVGGYFLLSNMNKMPTTTTPYTGQYGQLQQSVNPTRNSQSQDLINYAIAAGLAADAIADMIERFNDSSDDQIKNVYDYVNTTGDIQAYA